MSIDEFVQQSQLSESATTVKRRRQMGLAWMTSVLLWDGTVTDDRMFHYGVVERHLKYFLSAVVSTKCLVHVLLY